MIPTHRIKNKCAKLVWPFLKILEIFVLGNATKISQNDYYICMKGIPI